jgi:hypothetical protein
VKAYLLTTGTLFGLMTVWHVFIMIEHWGHSESGFHAALAPIVIVIASGALAAWAFRLAWRVPGAAA